MSRRARQILRLALLAATGLLVTTPAAHATTGEAAFLAQMSSLRTVLDTTVRAYADRKDGADPRYYEDGLWVAPFSGCFTCALGPAMGAAVLADTQPAMLPIVVASVDRAILEHQRPNGAYYGPGNSDAIQSAWTIPILGTIYLTIGDRVDAATRERWARSIVAGADWLLSANETVWYVNGNINLSYTEALWIAWKISGEARFRTAYEASWTFTVDPPKPRWASFGLRYTTEPTRSDGSDGAGYLVESGGYDPEYTMAQLEVAASWYVLSREPRALRLMNLLTNQLLARVGPTYTLDARNGSRHSLLTPFMTSGLSVLVGSGTRPDLAVRLSGQLTRVANEYAGAINYTHPSFYRGVGGWLATPVLFARGMSAVPQVPRPAAPSPAKPTTPAPSPKPARPAVAPKPAVPAPPAAGQELRAASLTVASRADVRRGAFAIRVAVARNMSVKAALRCGHATCGTASTVRGSGSAPVTLRVRLTRAWQRSVRRSGTRRAVVIVTVRSGRDVRTIRRSLRLVG